MMRGCKKKQTLTLLEIMIVVFLIGLIGSVIGYNMKGSLEEGKAFKTAQSQEKLHDILMLEVAKGATIDEVVKEPIEFLKDSGLVKNPDKLIVDGWNQRFDIHADQYGTDILIKSTSYEKYISKKNARTKSRNKHADQTPADQEAELLTP
ncbi:MAG: type II secretion system protein [Chlamydiales bacterium]|nr:type II secretion system protein [Chlamydiales bacterium]